MPVSSTIRYTFDVAKFEDYSGSLEYASHTLPVFHKDVEISFTLSLYPHDTRKDFSNFLGVYLRYIDGPKADVALGYELFVVTDIGSISLGKSANRTLSRGGGIGHSRQLPRSLEALADGSYLKSNNALLEVEAKITIPDDAFDNPDGSCKALVQPERSQPAIIAKYLFGQLTTPTATNHPFSDRFQLRATDDSSFWAHKGILALSSEVFKGWFDSYKPPKAQSLCFREGVMAVDLDRDALWHLLHFVYLGETAHGFDKYAMEIVDAAERFQFKKLTRICERSLLGQAETMSVDSLFECLKESEKFGLAQLKTATVNKLIEGLGGKEKRKFSMPSQKVLLSVIEYAHQHELTALKQVCDAKLAGTLQYNVCTKKFLAMVSVARKNDLHRMALGKWCSTWMAHNHLMFKDGGHLKALMNDQTEDGQGVIEFLIEILSNVSLQQAEAK